MKDSKNSKSLISMSVAAVSVLALAACLPESSEGGGETSGGADGGGGEEPQRLVLAQSADFRTLDPHDNAATAAERIMANMYSRLFVLDENMEPVPDLVTDYEQVDDLTWQFEIRDDATFHDGSPLDAEDVVFSLTRSSTEETLEEYGFFRVISDIVAVDEYTVEITTEEPNPTLLRLLAKSGGDILPSELIDEVGIDEFIREPIGSGPYQLVSYQQDSSSVLESYDDYYGETPVWDEVEFRVIPESSTRVSELVTGGVDIITDIPPVDWDRLDGEGENAEVIFGDTTRVMMLVLRNNEPWVTSDPRVREAMDLAIDNEALTEQLFYGEATPVRSRVPEGVFGSNPDLNDTFVYDPERAAELVEEAGGGDPIEIHLTSSRGNYPLDADVAEMVVSMLEEVGFDVTVEILEGTTFSQTWANKEQQEAQMIGLADGFLDAAYAMDHYLTSIHR